MSCPDPEELAGVAANAAIDERARAVLDHAASCDECHAALAALRPMTASATPTGPTPTAATRTGTGSTGFTLPPAPAAATPMPEAGAQVDRYVLGRVLGRGAMGVVYSAHDPELEREVALKILRPSASAPRLRREAQSLARLAHPNVVRVYDVGEYQGQAFVAMELVRGQNLREWLTGERAVDEILDVLARAAQGLAAAHRAGLVHRDVKPDNVLVAEDGGVLVGDFGLAREASASQDGPAPPSDAMPLSVESLTATGAVVGTPAYMAPEQAVGEATPQSDQYAFCITAWEALYGQRPIQGTSLHQLRDHARRGVIAPPPPGRDVPARIERALRRGLSSDPAARFPSMDALLAAMAPPVSRRRLALGLGAAAMVVVVGGTLATLAVFRDPAGTSAAAACARAGDAMDATWTPAIAAQVEQRTDGSTADSLGFYAARWRSRRIEACRATHQERTQSADTLGRQVACLESARSAFQQLLAGVVASSSELVGPALLGALPALDRCQGEARPQAPPPAEHAAAIAAFDARIATVEVGALSRIPKVSAEQLAALRTEVAAVGYPPQVMRVRLLEGLLANLLGDEVAAAAVYREVMVAAEAVADDFSRARAGALLALQQARLQDPTAPPTITAARAALARAGRDESIELLLLTAEAVRAYGRKDFAGAARIDQAIVALTLANFGPDAPTLAETYAHLAGAYALGGEAAQAGAVYTTLSAFIEREARRRGGSADVAALISRDVVEPLTAGDFAGVFALGERQLAYWRSLPQPPVAQLAYITSTMGIAHELDNDLHGALASYREAEALWARPPADFEASGDPLDPTAIAAGRTENAMATGVCLVKLDRAGEAVPVLRRAVELGIAGGEVTADQLWVARRWLGIALAATGAHAEAVELLTPIVEQLPPDTKPYVRAEAQMALARSLWAVGGARERTRAQALMNDAAAALEEAAVPKPAEPFLRKLPPLARAKLAELRGWQAAHPAAR